jgi:hypothetical protein
MRLFLLTLLSRTERIVSSRLAFRLRFVESFVKASDAGLAVVVKGDSCPLFPL